jgi:hypothetical protein
MIKFASAKKVIFFLLFFIVQLIFALSNTYPSDLYDLCYRAETLLNGKLFFLRYRNPLRDPVLRTYEMNLFDPHSKKIIFLQKYEEKIYIPPVLSRDKTTVTNHSLIEGSDYVVTRNIETGVSTYLRFDTGGYFVTLGLDFDNDTIVSAIKRGENKQALYLISNRASKIRRIMNGRSFNEVGFLYNGNNYFLEQTADYKVLGYINAQTRYRKIIAEAVDKILKAPNGDSIIYLKGKDLYLYRVYNNESIQLSSNFLWEKHPPHFASDGSTVALLEKNKISIVNIPSGDVLYLLSMGTDSITYFLTNFSLFVARENSILRLEYKKPGQSLSELYKYESSIELLSVSPNERYLMFKSFDDKRLYIYEHEIQKMYEKTFPFVLKNVISTDLNDSVYFITRSHQPESDAILQELYMYNFVQERLYPISTSANTEIMPYLRRE